MYSMILYEVHKQARLKTLHEKLIRNAIMKSVISSESTDLNFTNKRPNVQHLMIQQDAPAIKSYQTKKKNNRPLRLSTLLDLWVYKKKQWTENYMSPPDQPTPKCEEFCRTTDLVHLTNECQKKKKKSYFFEFCCQLLGILTLKSRVQAYFHFVYWNHMCAFMCYTSIYWVLTNFLPFKTLYFWKARV